MHKICSNYVVRMPLTHRIVFDKVMHFTHSQSPTIHIDTGILSIGHGLYIVHELTAGS